MPPLVPPTQNETRFKKKLIPLLNIGNKKSEHIHSVFFYKYEQTHTSLKMLNQSKYSNTANPIHMIFEHNNR